MVIVVCSELEREYEESLSRNVVWRADFSRVKCGSKASHVFREDKSSFRVYFGDVWSTNNGPLSFCVSGKARWCLSNVVLPSAWNENVKWGWESDYLEKESVRGAHNYFMGYS